MLPTNPLQVGKKMFGGVSKFFLIPILLCALEEGNLHFRVETATNCEFAVLLTS